jgi:hypothetical protein
LKILEHPAAQGGYATFKPHFMHRRCSYEAGSPECGTNCIHGGRYCAVDSVGDAYTDRFEGWQARTHHTCPEILEKRRGKQTKRKKPLHACMHDCMHACRSWTMGRMHGAAACNDHYKAGRRAHIHMHACVLRLGDSVPVCKIAVSCRRRRRAPSMPPVSGS